LIVAQCDLLIFRLRANAAGIPEFIEELTPIPGQIESSFSIAENENVSPADTTIGRLQLDIGPGTYDFGDLTSNQPHGLRGLEAALPHMELLSKIETKLWVRRKRAFRNFVALRKAVAKGELGRK
jgi:hypothetical protein